MGFFKKLFGKKEDEWEWKGFSGPGNYTKYKNKKTGQIIYERRDNFRPMIVRND